MTSRGARRNLAIGLMSKIGLPLLLGLITIVSSDAGGLSGRSSLELAAVVTLASMLVLFLIDLEIRLSELQDHIGAGFQKIDRSTELLNLIETSVLETALLTDLVEAVGKADASVSPLLQRLA